MNLDEIREFLALETRLDELRASYRATKGATSKKARAEQKATLAGGAGAERVAGRADQRQAGPHGRRSGPSWRSDAERCRELLAELD